MLAQDVARAWLFAESPLCRFPEANWFTGKTNARAAEIVEGCVQKVCFSGCRSSSFDLIVIGGGPAGSMAALSAQRKGVSTLLLEREETIGDHVICGEAVSSWIFRDFLTWNPDWISSKITRVAFRGNDWRVFRVNLPNAGWILNRRVFDRDLGRMARNAGVTLLTGALVTGLVRENGHPVGVRAEIEGKERHYFAPVIIGADGISSMVGRWAGLDTRLGLGEVTSCSQVLVRGEDIYEDTVEFVMGTDVAPGGYAWVFPKGKQTANVGVGVCPTHTTKKAKDYLLSFVDRRFKNPRVLDRKSGGVPSTFKGEIARENVLLCGDAARVCHPLTGGGIYNAAATGSLAGSAVAKEKMSKIARRYTVGVMRKLGFELKLGEELRGVYLQLNQAQLEELWEFASRRFSDRTISVLHPLRILGLFFCAHPLYLKYLPRLARSGLQMSKMI